MELATGSQDGNGEFPVSGIDPPSPSPRGENFPVPVPILAKVIGRHFSPIPVPRENWSPTEIPVPDTEQDKSKRTISMTKT